MSETTQVELIRTVPAVIAALAAITCAVLQFVGQRKHKNHEATTDANRKQGAENAAGIAEIRLTLNGALDTRIDEAVKRHTGQTLK